MKKINNTPIPLIIADSLLKLNEYDGDFSQIYVRIDSNKIKKVFGNTMWVLVPNTFQNIITCSYILPAPTIQEFRNWLSEKHNISYLLERYHTTKAVKCSNIFLPTECRTYYIKACTDSVWNSEVDAHFELFYAFISYLIESFK